ncbi:MAG: O-antigen ligase family protein, partial [Clostridia bacterium]|nr:O-antigen ligase family protein [Clostridia bacterium]
MKRQHRKPPSLTALVSHSLILPLFYRIAVFLYQSVRESIVGRFFCGYDRANDAMQNGILAALRRRLHLSDRILRPLRFTVAAQFDNSAILCRLRRLLDQLAGMPLGTYGLAALFFSLFSCIAYVLSYASGRNPEIADLIMAAAFLLIGICLVASTQHFSEALSQSRLASFLLFRIAGANEEYFRTLPHTQGMTVAAAAVGSLFGLLTFVIPPLWLVLGGIGCCAAFFVYKIPEAGVVAVLFLAPFLPTMVLVAFMMYLLFCYFIKYLRGKRVFRVEYMDLCVMLFAAVFFFAGLFSASPAQSLFPVLVFLCFLSGYFLVVNLIRSTPWVQRCYLSALSSAVLVALYGIYQNFFVTADTTWQDTEMFEDISGRVVSTLENPNVLAEYLIMILPIAVAGFFCAKLISQKMVYLFAGGIIGACLIFTWSRGAWLGLIIAMLLFLLMYSKKVLVIGLFGILAVPFLPFVLPQSILNRFLSIGNLGDTSTSYRVHIWEGTLAMLRDHFLGGIGVGTGVFGEVYPRYALSGIESAPHSHNLYLQIFVETGILGLALFAVFLFTFARHNFTFYAKPLPQTPRVYTAALFCGLLAVLAQGMTDYIWYNY